MNNINNGIPLSLKKTFYKNNQSNEKSKTDDRALYLVDSKELKNEAKQIKKSNPENFISYTQILNVLITNLGFYNYSEYEQYIHKPNDKTTKTLDSLPIHTLKILQSKILGKLLMLGFEIEKIHFIQMAINIKIKTILEFKAFSMRTYLYTLPHTLNLNGISCINTDTSEINEPGLTAILDMLLKKYQDNQSEELKRFVNFCLFDGKINFFELYEIMSHAHIPDINRFEYLKHKNYRELYYALHNNELSINNKEGLLFLKLLSLYKKQITIDDIIEHIRIEVKNEIEFLNEFKLDNSMGDDSPNTKMSIPTFEKESEYNSNHNLLPNFISTIKNNTDDNNIFHLGKDSPQNTLFKTMNHERLNKQEFMSNILLSGSIGSGVAEIHTLMLAQSLMNNKGFILFDFEGVFNIAKILSMAKDFGKESDVLIFSSNHVNKILNLDINKLIKNNNIVLITFPSLEKSDDNTNFSNLNIIEKVLNKINVKSLGNYPYNISFARMMHYESEDYYTEAYDIIFKQILRINKLNINSFIRTEGIQNLTKTALDKILNAYKVQVIFKQWEIMENMQQIVSADTNFSISRYSKLKELKAGIYYLVKNNKIALDEKPYIANYYNIKSLKNIQLNYF